MDLKQAVRQWVSFYIVYVTSGFNCTFTCHETKWLYCKIIFFPKSPFANFVSPVTERLRNHRGGSGGCCLTSTPPHFPQVCSRAPHMSASICQSSWRCDGHQHVCDPNLAGSVHTSTDCPETLRFRRWLRINKKGRIVSVSWLGVWGMQPTLTTSWGDRGERWDCGSVQESGLFLASSSKTSCFHNPAVGPQTRFTAKTPGLTGIY